MTEIQIHPEYQGARFPEEQESLSLTHSGRISSYSRSEYIHFLEALYFEKFPVLPEQIGCQKNICRALHCC